MSLQIILKNSSVSGKEPTASQLANGELALNYHADGPFISCKDSAGTVRRIAGVWISTTAPTSPTPGEFWLDTNTDPAKLKVYKDGTDTWVETITIVAASTTAAGVVELATDAETQAGSLANRAVTPASLQSKVSDSTTTTSSTTIASSTAVKSAKDVADAALPAAGGTISGNLTVSGDLTVNGTTTTIDTTTLIVEDKNIEMGAVGTPTDVTADGGGITLKGATDKTLNWVDSTDSWTSSENVDLASGKTYKIAGTDVLSATALGSAVQISSDNIPSGTIVNDDVNASAAIAGTKIDPDFGSQTVETTGVFSAAGGAEATPSITFTGDLNTGIYSPGADQFAISTAGTAAIEIDSSQRVGIGTSSPQANLHVVGASGGAGEIYISDVDVSAAGASSLLLTQSGNHSFLYNRNTAGSLRLGAGGTSNYVSIDSSGNVGVGTTSPTRDFDLVRTDGAAQMRVETTFVGGDARLELVADNTGISQIRFGDQDTVNVGLITYDHGTDSFRFNTNSSQQVFIDSSGNLGIGVASPSTLLHLQSSTNNILFVESSDSIADIIAADTTGSTRIRSTGGELSLWTGGDASSDNAANANQNVTINSSGNLGIGESTPTSSLHVVRSDYQVAKFESTAANANGAYIELYANSVSPATNDTLGIISYRGNDSGGNELTYAQIKGILEDPADTTESGAITFNTRDSGTFGERVRIDSSGNVGIGEDDPGHKLDLIGTTTSAFRIRSTSSATRGFEFWNNSTTDEAYISNYYGGPIIFQTSNSEKVRIDSSGRLLVGTTSARTTGSGFTAYSQVESASTVSGASFSLISNRSTDTLGSRLSFARSKGGSLGSNTVVAEDDELGGIYFYGADGTDTNSRGAQIVAEVDNTPGTNDMPGRLVFGTTANGETSPTTRLTLDSQGSAILGLSGTKPSYMGARTLGVGEKFSIFQAGSMDSEQLYFDVDAANSYIGHNIYYYGGWKNKKASSPVRLFQMNTNGFSFYRSNAQASDDSSVTPNELFRLDDDGILNTYSAIGETFYANTNTDIRTYTGSGSATGGVSMESTCTSTNTRYHISFSNPNGVVGTISTNGSSTSYTTSSDYRLKENIQPVSDGLERIKQLKPSRFNFITSPEQTVDGFLAHEVQDIVPEAVQGAKDEVETASAVLSADGKVLAKEVTEESWQSGKTVDRMGNSKYPQDSEWVAEREFPVYQNIDQSKLVPLLTAALQEAIAKIEVLEAKVAALESN